MNSKEFIKREYILLQILILIGVMGRVIFVGLKLQPFPNFEVIMVIAFLASIFIRSKKAILVPFLSMLISDIILGNNVFIGPQMNKIVIFTYSGFIFISILSYLGSDWFKRYMGELNLRSIAIAGGTGFIFTLIYDIWTNAGWWYIIYPHTSEAFIAVFLAGIPFMLYHLLSNIFMFIVLGLPVIAYIVNNQPLSEKKISESPSLT